MKRGTFVLALNAATLFTLLYALNEGFRGHVHRILRDVLYRARVARYRARWARLEGWQQEALEQRDGRLE